MIRLAKGFAGGPVRRMGVRATALFLVGAAVRCVAAPAQTPVQSSQGCNCLFMGHSFFAPIAKQFVDLAVRCGVPDHRQTVVFHGGEAGSPGSLWRSSAPDVVKAKALLETGTVDLLGLTFYPGIGSALSDYRAWVDLALKNNPRTRFVIQAPWPKYQNKSLAQYEAESEKCLAEVHRIIDNLRAVYPQSAFHCIPQGRWMVGLWRLFDEGKLPEVTVIKKAGKEDGRPSLFLDDTGHGGAIPVRMGALLWLATLYRVDLGACPWQTNTQSDLKKLAQEIVRNDPYCGLGAQIQIAK